MTQTDKNPFAELETIAVAKNTSDKEELDFSFFDEPPPSTVRQSTETQNDFSFLDDPAPAPQNDKTESAFDTSFSFDDTPPALPAKEAEDEKGEDDTKLKTPGLEKQSMLFGCLKCSHKELLEFPEFPIDNLKLTCSACSSAVTIIRESNARRATQKSMEIYCSTCGHALSHQPHCPSCGVFCPDYYLVENPAEVQRKARAARSNNLKQAFENLTSIFSRPTVGSSTAKPSYSDSYSAGKGRSFALNARQAKLLAASVLIVLSVCIGIFYYLKVQAENSYAHNYMKAVYAMHTASDAIVRSLSKTSQEWGEAHAAGKAYIPRTDTDMENRVARISAEASRLMQQLQAKVPGRYEQANSKLLDFHGELQRLQKATTAAPATYEQLRTMLADSEKRLKQKRDALKADLDDKLLAELADAKIKFRGFEEF